MLIDRWAKKVIEAALKKFRVVGVFGPRQSGKTTLVKEFAVDNRKYFNLEDRAVAELVRSFPNELVESNEMAVIDEVQIFPEMVAAIKHSVDNNQRRGRYIITGSSTTMVLPRATDSLAGRMKTINLHPFSLAELGGAGPDFLQMVFAGEMPRPSDEKPGNLRVAIQKGGFPLSVLEDSLDDSRSWLDEYIWNVIKKDFAQLGSFRRSLRLDKVLEVIAMRSGSLLSVTNLANSLQLSHGTADEIINLLEGMYVIKKVYPHDSRIARQLRKQPKLEFQDSGVLSSVLDFDPSNHVDVVTHLGKLAESFVFGELQKQNEIINPKHDIEFYRDRNQREVDFMVRSPDKKIVAIEVKASPIVNSKDFTVMRNLSQHHGDGFLAGMILHGGVDAIDVSRSVSVSKKHRFWSLPISSLWNCGAS